MDRRALQEPELEMADDPYSVLGVSKAATQEEITRAFRKLAKELHPDVNPNNKVATERFKKASAANELLSDPDKRRKYDRGEIDASGEPRRAYHPPGNPFGGGARRPAGAYGQTADEGAFGDIFDGLFGSRGRPTGGMRGQDLRYTLEVDLLEAVTGTKKRVTLPDGGVLDLNVPEGVDDGQVLRLKGKGAGAMRGIEPGDALVEIRVRPHPDFKRVGDDLAMELPISLDEAVLGAKIEVPTATGRVQLTVPKGTSSGRVFRLKGKGVVNRATGNIGDQLVTIRIQLPEKIDDGLAYFLSEWRQKNGYDPRKK
jgi:DnaJ-class molecular chaperone